MLGIGTQGLYDLLGAGLIKGVKRGTRTLLVVDSNDSNDALVTVLMATGEDRHLVWQSDVLAAQAA